ncbi:hypothetical protein QYE76_046102 [Lolium multiflorum]|uniref:Uncharacterized protein n=1 Tax=Lolium multiflorum TaxID=4521 RepID=A0AAD8TLI2_LOLMU|nr:hypothetical protein QYE76_046102 [Lolium multiflorum]
MPRLPVLRAHWRAAAGLLRRLQWHRIPRAAALKSPPAALLVRPQLHSHHNRSCAMEKKNDFEASGSGSKKVSPPVTVGRLMHGKWLSCDAWSGVQLPGGWRLSCRRVPIPPVPAREPDRTAEIRRRRRPPADLRADPAYAIDSELWPLPPALDLDSFPCVEEAIRVADEFCDQYRALRREVEILQEENQRLRRMLEYYSNPSTRPSPPHSGNNESLQVLVQNCKIEKLKLKEILMKRERNSSPSSPKE